MLANTNAIKNEKLRAKIADSADILRKNIKLIKLDTTSPDDSWHLIDTITRSEPNWNEVAKLADDYELKGFKKDLEAYLETQDESPNETFEPKQKKTDEKAMHQDDLFAEPPQKPKVNKNEQAQEKTEVYFTPDLFG